MPNNQNTVISIAGPTAIGKTKLAIHLANFFSTQILSADSRQFFKEMSIGTAKPSEGELAAAVHHGISIKSVSESFSAGEFETFGLKVLDQIHQTNPVAILVGGSGLYINALLHGLDRFPETLPGVREDFSSQSPHEHRLKVLSSQLVGESFLLSIQIARQVQTTFSRM